MEKGLYIVSGVVRLGSCVPTREFTQLNEKTNHLQEEPLLSRFFAYMSLFAGAMLVLVVAVSLVIRFFFQTVL